MNNGIPLWICPSITANQNKQKRCGSISSTCRKSPAAAVVKFIDIDGGEYREFPEEKDRRQEVSVVEAIPIP